MSIINDALKKVQQSLSSKAGETPVSPAEKKQPSSDPLFATPPAAETATHAQEQPIETLPPKENKIKSILAFICAILITAGSTWYIYQQFRNDIPKVQRLAKKSFLKLIHKEDIPDFKTKRPEDLKPLAQLTINGPTATPSTSAQAAAPITLNIHGIMADTTGKGNLALINDHVYQEGDEVDGAKIIKINLDSITVNINGAEKTIFVKN